MHSIHVIYVLVTCFSILTVTSLAEPIPTRAHVRVPTAVKAVVPRALRPRKTARTRKHTPQFVSNVVLDQTLQYDTYPNNMDYVDDSTDTDTTESIHAVIADPISNLEIVRFGSYAFLTNGPSPGSDTYDPDTKFDFDGTSPLCGVADVLCEQVRHSFDHDSALDVNPIHDDDNSRNSFSDYNSENNNNNDEEECISDSDSCYYSLSGSSKSDNHKHSRTYSSSSRTRSIWKTDTGIARSYEGITGTESWTIHSLGLVASPSNGFAQKSILWILRRLYTISSEQEARMRYRTALLFGKKAIGIRPNLAAHSQNVVFDTVNFAPITSFKGVTATRSTFISVREIDIDLGISESHGFYATNVSFKGFNFEKDASNYPSFGPRTFEMQSVVEVVIDEGKTISQGSAAAPIWFPERKGLLVIADIDDTLRIMGVLNVTTLLAKMLFDEYLPTPNLPELMNVLNIAGAQRYGTGSMFYYLSAGFMELSRDLEPFLASHFPAGEVHLRQGMLSIFSALSQRATFDYKTSVMDLLHERFPERTVVALGDSGQTDPEVYGEIARRYPGWIKCTLIRKVSGFNAAREATQNIDSRFETAFTGVDRSTWHIFTDDETPNGGAVLNGTGCGLN